MKRIIYAYALLLAPMAVGLASEEVSPLVSDPPVLGFPLVESHRDYLLKREATSPIMATSVRNIIISANKEFEVTNYHEAIKLYTLAHNVLNDYCSGDVEQIDFSGSIGAADCLNGVFYTEDQDAEIVSGYVANFIGNCYNHLGLTTDAGEWYGTAGWHFEADLDDLRPALCYHLLAAKKYLAYDNGFQYPALQQIKAGYRTAEVARDLPEPQDIKEEIRQYAEFCQLQRERLYPVNRWTANEFKVLQNEFTNMLSNIIASRK